jgi:hypothetical protein
MVRDIVRQLKANPDVIPIATVPAVKRTMEKVSACWLLLDVILSIANLMTH